MSLRVQKLLAADAPMPGKSIVRKVSTPDVKGKLPSARVVRPVSRPEIRCTSIAFPLSAHLLVGSHGAGTGGCKEISAKKKENDKALLQ